MFPVSFPRFAVLSWVAVLPLGLSGCGGGDSPADAGDTATPSVVLTDSYRVEYLAAETAAMEGKSTFLVRVTDAATGSVAQSGLSISLMPLMHMTEMTHSSPLEGCSESTTAGTYRCTLFYLMPSSMNGVAMGDWELKLTIAGATDEIAIFYPEVMMAMGDTTRARLKGVTDTLTDMGGNSVSRDYYLFRSELSGVPGSYSFELFVAAKESMMSFPALTSTTVLNAGDMNSELTVVSVLVEVSSDASHWLAATEEGGGYWRATGLDGLSAGQTGELYVRLSVNGEQKTTNGLSPDGVNGYATFIVTPASATM
ncbi:MAG TPA: hypothetical protein ENK35_00555 [Candidatus Tenderia sp.]|nr:hypothetical protein [Candidatus Tenderia sp.]